MSLGGHEKGFSSFTCRVNCVPRKNNLLHRPAVLADRAMTGLGARLKLLHNYCRGVGAMETALNILLGLALVGVVGVLATGLAGFAAGGEFNRKYGNKLMRLRVATQAFAVLVLLALLLLHNIGSSTP